jgi:hypothetical protein
VLGGLAAGPAAADDKALAQALRAGGLVIVLRHGATSADQADAEPVDFDNIAAQRNLNDKGKAAAVALGDAFRQIGVPVGKVYTSRFNRLKRRLAEFKEIEKTSDHYSKSAASPDRTSPTPRPANCSARRRNRAPTCYQTHTPNTTSMRSARTVEVKEGEASIFRSANGNPRRSRVQMDDWPRIAAAK